MDVTVDLDYDNYIVRSNSGKGDCLFKAIKQALKTVGIDKSVEDLRAIVADSVDEEQLGLIKTILEAGIKENDSTILDEFGWANGANTLEELRAKMMTSNYYGDETAIRALEESLGMYIAILQFHNKQYRIAVHQTEHKGYTKYILIRHDSALAHHELMLYKNQAVLDRLPIELEQRIYPERNLNGKRNQKTIDQFFEKASA